MMNRIRKWGFVSAILLASALIPVSVQASWQGIMADWETDFITLECPEVPLGVPTSATCSFYMWVPVASDPDAYASYPAWYYGSLTTCSLSSISLNTANSSPDVTLLGWDVYDTAIIDDGEFHYFYGKMNLEFVSHRSAVVDEYAEKQVLFLNVNWSGTIEHDGDPEDPYDDDQLVVERGSSDDDWYLEFDTIKVLSFGVRWAKDPEIYASSATIPAYGYAGAIAPDESLYRAMIRIEALPGSASAGSLSLSGGYGHSGTTRHAKLAAAGQEVQGEGTIEGVTTGTFWLTASNRISTCTLTLESGGVSMSTQIAFDKFDETIWNNLGPLETPHTISPEAGESGANCIGTMEPTLKFRGQTLTGHALHFYPKEVKVYEINGATGVYETNTHSSDLGNYVKFIRGSADRFVVNPPQATSYDYLPFEKGYLMDLTPEAACLNQVKWGVLDVGVFLD